MKYLCVRCGALNAPVGDYYMQGLPRPHRCDACGAVHSILNDSFEVISPVNAGLPVDAPHCRRSPWMLPRFRPCLPGNYEVRFTDLEPDYMVLRWDGARFRDAHDAVVSERTLLSWRGWWQ